MRLARVKLRNFRCHQEDTDIEISNLTAIIGKNDAGKSSILEALKIFFEDGKPDADDASNAGDKGDCRIICEFDELPEKIVVDVSAETSLAGEYLLNEAGRLEIHKVYDCNIKSPKLKATYALAFHPSAAGFNNLLLLKNTELKKLAEKENVTVADKKVNAQLRKALWASCKKLDCKAQEVLLTGEGTRPIWDQISRQMPMFQLFKSDRPSTDQDEEAQDPMKAAVREALRSKEAELEAIAKHVESEVRLTAERTVEKIRDMDATLANQLHPQFSTPKWDSVFKISLTDDQQVPVNKRGSGVRRLILLNFFRAKAERQISEQDRSGVIYAIEEPETSQHPNSQKLLMRALQELSEQPGCQVLITTHTPTLSRLLPVKSLRYIECHEGGRRSIHQGNEGTAELVAKALGVLPDNDIKLFIGVEGINDILFLQGISSILHAAGEDVPNLVELEDDGVVVFMPLGGSNLERWVGRMKGLNRPEFHLYDRDEAPPKRPKYHATIDALAAQDSCTAYATNKLTLENYLHAEAITDAKGITIAFTEYCDVPHVAAKAVHEQGGGDDWAQITDKDKIRSKVNNAKRWLNTDAVLKMTPARLTESDPAGDIRRWLAEMGTLIAQA